MSLNIIFQDFPKICRLCLQSGELRPLLNLEILNLFSTITNIKVKEDDKLPENVCDECIQQLVYISAFIDTCRINDETLRSIAEKEYEQSLTFKNSQNCPNLYEKGNVKSEDNDDEDDVKSENDEDEEDDDVKFENDADNSDDFYAEDVKEVLLTEPDINLNEADIPSACLNCKENFPNKKSLFNHYIETINCRPSDFDSHIPNEPNIVDYLKKGGKKGRKPGTKSKRIKVKLEDTEPEYIKGRKLKGKRRFLCCYCGKNYTRKNGLDRHILSHTGVKPFECKECGKRYITKDTLKTHILTHTGVKAYKCTVCQKSFTQSSHLSYHMRRHSGEKPFSCSFCGKAFLSSYHLERHKLMHTGVKPFQCKLCGKQFVRGTTLRDHLLIHSGEKPFVCQHCGKQFNRKQSLTNHVLVHTGGQPRNSGGSGGLPLPLPSNLLYSQPNPMDAVNSGY